MISVCMATYNGAKVIEKQLVSILKQLSSVDEIIIVDDASTDETRGLIKKISAPYPAQLILLENPQNLGPIRSFEKALQASSGDYIFFTDQDDEWFLDKVATVMAVITREKSDLVVHDGVVIDGQGAIVDPSWNHYNHNDVHQGVLGNLKKNGYTGAMMTISRRLANASLPFPNKLEMHDQWFFLIAKKLGYSISIIEKPLMNYVRHGGNVTGMRKRTGWERLRGRLRTSKNILTYKKNNRPTKS